MFYAVFSQWISPACPSFASSTTAMPLCTRSWVVYVHTPFYPPSMLIPFQAFNEGMGMLALCLRLESHRSNVLVHSLVTQLNRHLLDRMFHMSSRLAFALLVLTVRPHERHLPRQRLECKDPPFHVPGSLQRYWQRVQPVGSARQVRPGQVPGHRRTWYSSRSHSCS